MFFIRRFDSLLLPLFLLVLLLPGRVLAEDNSVVEVFNLDYYSLTPHVYLFHDTSSEMTLDEVIAADEAGEFEKNAKSTLNIGFLDTPVWLRFDIAYPDSYPNREVDQDWYLEVGASLLDVGLLYERLPDGRYVERQADNRIPFDERELDHVFSVFPITLTRGETRRFYVKMQTSGSFYAPITLWEPEAYAVKVANEEFVYGLFYGSMLCIIIFNLFIYFAIRDVGYLYYLAYLACITLLFLIDLGHGVNLFDSGAEIFHKNYLNTIIWLNWIFVCGFLRAFLETKGTYPMIDAFFTRVSMVALIYLVLDLFMPYNISISWGALSTLVLFLAFAPICIHVWRRGNVNALYFLVAWTLNMFGLSVYCLLSLGYLPSTTMLTSLAPLGILSEAVLLSFALAERVKRTQRSMLDADQLAMDHLSRYQSLFDNALEGIYQLSLDGHFLRANPAMARNLGYSHPRELMSDRGRAANYCYVAPETQYRTLADKKQLKEEMLYTRRDGTRAWADHSAQLIYDDDDSPSHIEGTFTDVTERKAREEAEKQREQERTEKEIAKSLAAAKTEFLANMSHQIRTPLTAIIGHSEAIRSLNLTGSEKEEAVKIIAHSSQRLLKLINEILDYSKIEAGKLEVERTSVDVDDVLYQVQHRFRWQAEQKGLEFTINYESQVPDHILSDPSRIHYILECLVGNAVKYTKKGFVRLSLSWSDDQLHISVSDSGIGMSVREVSRLFDVFSLHDESQIREYGGSRLSMAIAKELSVLLGGDLTVESSQGNGSEFTLRFVAPVTARADWIAPRQGLVKDAREKADTRKSAVPVLNGSVLVAEDNKVNQTLINKVITKTGAQVTLVDNGQLALEAARENRFDLVLMDINMPVLNGLDACRQLKQEEIGYPVYALTAETDEKELAKAIACGCRGALSKPLNREALYAVLEEHLAAKQ